MNVRVRPTGFTLHYPRAATINKLAVVLGALAILLIGAGTAFAYAGGQCTDYAWHKRQDLPSNLGDAKYWAANARAQGFLVSSQPDAGTIVVFQPGANGAGSNGHVAYVESVSPDHRSMRISEWNFCAGGCPYRLDYRTLATSDGKPGDIQFIYWKGQLFPYEGYDIKMTGSSSGFKLDEYGQVTRLDGSVVGGALWSRWDIARSLAVRSDGVSGYVLDGWGGIHPFGGAPGVSGSAYWNGFDIAHSLVLFSDTSGYVLDGYGGIHPFGGAPVPIGSAYWNGFDIARSIVLRPDRKGGYVLDGYGGIHPFAVGSNPMPAAATDSAYWQGFDIARSMVLNSKGTGGYVLDGYGGIHPLTVGPNPMPAGITVSAYWLGWDIARGISLNPQGSGGEVIDGYGGIHPFTVPS